MHSTQLPLDPPFILSKIYEAYQLAPRFKVSGWCNDWAMNDRECLPSCYKNTVKPVHVLVVNSATYSGQQGKSQCFLFFYKKQKRKDIICILNDVGIVEKKRFIT